MGSSAAAKFWQAMIAAGDLLSSNPYLGKIEPILHSSVHEYRSLIQHRDFKIIYYMEENKIQIVSIWHCRNNVFPK